MANKDLIKTECEVKIEENYDVKNLNNNAKDKVKLYLY